MALPAEIHLDHEVDPATLEALADFICGDTKDRYPVYRSSSNLNGFFQTLNIDAVHDGSTRKDWVIGVLKQLPLPDIEKVILRLVDIREYRGVQKNLRLAVTSMNEILSMEHLVIELSGIRPLLKQVDPLALNGMEFLKPTPTIDEEEFLNKPFNDAIKIQELGLDAGITGYLQSRVNEAQACPRNKVSLGIIFLLGSTLEGMLLAFALKDQARYMRSATSPKERGGAVKPIRGWKLAELIEVAYAEQDINLDVRKFSHVLRDFRNYIHPFHQMDQSFSPDQHTVDICWQVFKAAFSQLKPKTGA